MTVDSISKLPLRSPSSTTRRLLPRYQRRQINNDDLIASIDQVGLKLADCLSIAESTLDTLVQRRPSSDTDLPEAAQKTPGVAALPFGLANIATTFQDALRGKFTDQVGDIYPLADLIADQLSPTVNMLQIGRRPEGSLHTILDENPDFESQGSTEIVTETAAVQPPFPPFRGSRIFNVSVDHQPI